MTTISWPEFAANISVHHNYYCLLFCEDLRHHVLKTLRREIGILWQIISDKVALEGHTEGGMIYMSREQTPSKGGDKQTWPRKAPCSPSALAFFAPSLQIKSGIPRLGLSYPRSYHCINFTPHHSFRECKKQLLKPNIVSDSPKRGHSILIVCGFLVYGKICVVFFLVT